MSARSSSIPRVVIVTGGSGVIGRKVAERLGADGMSVVVNYAGNAGRAQEAVDQITRSGGNATAIGGDVADEKDMAKLFDETERIYGGVDVCVNAAGVGPLCLLVDLDLADFDRIIRTNLRGTFVVSQQAARRIRPGGSIVNFSSEFLKMTTTALDLPGTMPRTRALKESRALKE